MIKHCIILASAYSIGKRIVLDYCAEDQLQLDDIQKEIDFIVKECGHDAPISTHFIHTDSKEWNSVRKTDKFFADTFLVGTKERFVKILLADRELIGMDIAKYILSKITCTHLKLEKLVYMCYADYLCRENEKLFNDKIFAYRLGPVIESVYSNYKKPVQNQLIKLKTILNNIQRNRNAYQ